MIDLITGLPGNCKTLYTISWVKAWSEKENRPVYYSGIPELTLPWTEIEPTEWMNCPPGSIIVIDECQRIYRNRSINAQAPKYVTDLETHRHLGVDLVFITQHPMLIDPALRRLVGRHRHMIRIFGMAASNVHEWSSCRETCDKSAGRKDSQSSKWLFDKSCYAYYKSAEVHTGKRMIPKRVIFLAVAPFLVVGLALYAKHALSHVAGQPEAVPGANANGPFRGGTGGGGGAIERGVDPVEDAKNWAWSQTPRIESVPYTAPKYDELTKPTVAPRPAACVSRASGCKCYTQQGTPYPMQRDMCMDIVQHGYFQEFKDKEDDDTKRERSSVAGDYVQAEAVGVPRVVHADPAPVSVASEGGGDVQVIRGAVATSSPVVAPPKPSHKG